LEKMQGHHPAFCFSNFEYSFQVFFCLKQFDLGEFNL